MTSGGTAVARTGEGGFRDGVEVPWNEPSPRRRPTGPGANRGGSVHCGGMDPTELALPWRLPRRDETVGSVCSLRATKQDN